MNSIIIGWNVPGKVSLTLLLARTPPHRPYGIAHSRFIRFAPRCMSWRLKQHMHVVDPGPGPDSMPESWHFVIQRLNRSGVGQPGCGLGTENETRRRPSVRQGANCKTSEERCQCKAAFCRVGVGGFIHAVLQFCRVQSAAS